MSRPDDNPPISGDGFPDAFSTLSVHGGERRSKAGNALVTPIAQTATYTFADTQELCDHHEGRIEREEYGRYGNPTQAVVERKIAALERAGSALVFSSGMNAITTTLFAFLSKGGHMIITDDSYRRTRQFCTKVLTRFGVDVSVVPCGDYDRLESTIKPNTRVLFSETPTNPYLNVLDLERFAAIGRKYRVKTIVDATFATPINSRPIEYGIDLVIHAATKYLGGHNDLLAGAVAGNPPLVAGVKDMLSVLGGVPDPFACWLLLRGLKTLSLRVERQNANALAIARFLEKHPAIERVYYPGLESHPQHAIAARQMRGFGGVVSFEVKGDLEEVSRFIDACRIPRIAPSLGGVESLIEQPALMSFYELSTEERLAVGIKNNLVRMAVGIEDGGSLIADLEQALRVLSA
ncbi:MAG: Cystathionine gamma-synthase [Myxococcota bacterium]|nr:Cystathionine gamma-synthase [Myxococcota bacterium]